MAVLTGVIATANGAALLSNVIALVELLGSQNFQTMMALKGPPQDSK